MGRRTPDNHSTTAIERREIYKYIYIYVQYVYCTYACVVETEAVEGHLEVEIFVQLRHRGVNVLLIVAIATILVSVEEPVHEIAAQLGQAGGGDGIASSCG